MRFKDELTLPRIFGNFEMDAKTKTITSTSLIKLIVSWIVDDFINDFDSE